MSDSGATKEKRNGEVKMKKLMEVNWSIMGAEVAVMGDKEQAEFFTGFAKELEMFDTHYQRELQMLSVNDKLKKNIRDILEKYLPALWEKCDD